MVESAVPNQAVRCYLAEVGTYLLSTHGDQQQTIAAKKGSTMSVNPSVHRIAIVGTGVIGASWASYYLSRGFDVVATDPAAGAEANLRKYVDDAWPALAKAGVVVAGASRDRLSFTSSMQQALVEADFVQENGPERP